MISVIIPAKNASATLANCLQAILEQEGFQPGLDYEVIVVDDGSTDDTLSIARKFPVGVIQQENKGPAVARNTGARNARGELLVFTDADCVPTPAWLGHLTSPFTDPGVVGVKGVYRTRQTTTVPRFVQLEYEYKYARMRHMPTIDFIDTYSAAYRKEVFLQNGGFDESFPVPSVEDQEFSFRLARKGYTLKFEPRAQVFHQHDRTLSEYLQRKFGIGYWKAFMLRWIPEKAFRDSHTAPSQRVEILLLALMLLNLLLIFYQPGFFSYIFLLFALLFILTISPFLLFILRRDVKVLPVAPWMLLARAGALGAGLVKGIILAPQLDQKGFACTSMRVRWVKRVLDILGGSLGLLLSSPLIALAGIAIRLDSPGPVFFRQLRAGENGKPFTMLKLRTMVVDAEDLLADVVHRSQLSGPVYKIPNDPRVTRVGRFLRRWSLDELPQFWNVIKGDMSLVGPRPEEVRIVNMYSDYQRLRLMVKPGLTGPMQVNGRGGLDFDRRLQMELDYLRNYSLLEDTKILLKTLSAVFKGEGIQ